MFQCDVAPGAILGCRLVASGWRHTVYGVWLSEVRSPASDDCGLQPGSWSFAPSGRVACPDGRMAVPGGLAGAHVSRVFLALHKTK